MSSPPALTQHRRPQSKRPLAALVLLVVVGLLFAGWWWGRGPQSWWTARSLVEALKRGDCVAAAKYYSGTTPTSDCSPSAYGLPDDLSNYSLHWDRVGRGQDDDQTAVAVTVPGNNTAYSLHMVRQGVAWVVDEVATTA
jgi:hypothetical protein